MKDGLARALEGTFGSGCAYGVALRTVDLTKLLACLGPLERAVRALVHDFADVGWLDVVTEAGLVRVVSAAKDALVERALDDVACTSIANGSGFRWRRATGEVAPPICHDHHELLRALRARSFLRESLVSQDSVLGVLTVAATRDGVRYGLRDHRTVEACARGLAYLVATRALAE